MHIALSILHSVNGEVMLEYSVLRIEGLPHWKRWSHRYAICKKKTDDAAFVFFLRSTAGADHLEIYMYESTKILYITDRNSKQNHLCIILNTGEIDMTYQMTVTLTDQEYAALAAEAARNGKQPETLLQDSCSHFSLCGCQSSHYSTCRRVKCR